MVGASGFEPPTSWSRTKNIFIDSVSLNYASWSFLMTKLDPKMDPLKQKVWTSRLLGQRLTFSAANRPGSLVDLGARKIVALVVDSARDQDSTVL